MRSETTPDPDLYLPGDQSCSFAFPQQHGPFVATLFQPSLCLPPLPLGLWLRSITCTRQRFLHRPLLPAQTMCPPAGRSTSSSFTTCTLVRTWTLSTGLATPTSPVRSRSLITSFATIARRT